MKTRHLQSLIARNGADIAFEHTKIGVLVNALYRGKDLSDDFKERNRVTYAQLSKATKRIKELASIQKALKVTLKNSGT